MLSDEPTSENIFRKLEVKYSEYGIKLNFLGIDYINNNNYLSIDNEEEKNQLFQEKRKLNAINYYIVDDVFSNHTGIAEAIPSTALLIKKENVLNSVSYHLLGHCLGLYHTHETLFGKEQKNNINCLRTGDLVCDTPADPNLLGNIGDRCGYNPIGVEIATLEPDTRNIMSNSFLPCRSRFSIGQTIRMKNALLRNSILTNVQSCPNLSKGKICSSNSEVIYLNNPPSSSSSAASNASTSWTSSSNIRIISSTENQIVVQKINSGKGWIKAVLKNNFELHQEITLGTPLVNELDIRSLRTYKLLGGQWAELSFFVDENSFYDEDKVEWSFSKNIFEQRGEGSLISVRPDNGGYTNWVDIGVRIGNSCGASSWTYQTFTIEVVNNNLNFGTQY